MHVANPQMSVFCIMTASDLNTLPPASRQKLLRFHHVITPGSNFIADSFNLEALLKLCNYSTLFNVQGQYIFSFFITFRPDRVLMSLDFSIDSGDSLIHPPLRRGTIADFLASASSTDGSGKILAATHFPAAERGWKPTPFSLELVAWKATNGMPFCKDLLPVGDFNFSSISIKGAHRWLGTFDCGLGTAITIRCGAQYVIVARPRLGARAEAHKPTGTDFDRFGLLDLLSPSKFNPLDPNHPDWVLEAVYLGPGMTM